MPFPIAAAAQLGGSMVSSAGGLASSLMNMNQEGINRDDRRFYAENAHQVEVKDLKAAGLNPILSATGGSGASFQGASSSNVGAGLGAGIASSASMLAELPRVLADLAVAEGTAKKLEQDSMLSEAQRMNTHAETTLKAAALDKIEKEKKFWGPTASLNFDLLRKDLAFREASTQAASASAESYKAGAESSRASAYKARQEGKQIETGHGFRNEYLHDAANIVDRLWNGVQQMLRGSNNMPVGRSSAK